MIPTTLAGAPPAMDSLSGMIGNTPLLALDFRFAGRNRRVYAKCEYLNLTGSIKDRMALHILRRAYEDGQLQPGGHIVEATSGNTGISFAALGRALGHPVTIFMPDWMSAERKQLMASYGARIVPVSHAQGGFRGAIEMAEEMARREAHVFLPRQFSNRANTEAHAATTGPEILFQLRDAGIEPRAFVAGVGTGGTVMGVGDFLRREVPGVRVHAVEPAESPTLSAGHCVGKHRIQGISDEFIPPIVELDRLDETIAVSDGDSIRMAQMLAARLGLGVGISSGCNFLAAALVQETLAQEKRGDHAAVVTVFADDNKKYLTTYLLRAEPERPGYVSSQVGNRRVSACCRAMAGPAARVREESMGEYDSELSKIVAELNRRGAEPAAAGAARARGAIHGVARKRSAAAAARGASDVLLIAGAPADAARQRRLAAVPGAAARCGRRARLVLPLLEPRQLEELQKNSRWI